MDEKNDSAIRKKAFQALVHGGQIVMRDLRGMEGCAQKKNDELLRKILQKNAQTEYGRKYGFAEIRSGEEYAARVPLMDYSDYAPYIERMSEQGEENVLTASKVDFYFSTAGTTGRAKLIPSTREQIRLIIEYTNLYRYAMISDALGDIWTEGATLSPVEVRSAKTGSGAERGCFSSKLFQDLGDVISYATLSPKEAVYSDPGEDTQFLHLLFALKREDVTEMNASYVTMLLEVMRRLEMEWEVFVQSIREGSLPASLSLSSDRREALQAVLRPDPERADFLQQEFRKGFDDPILPRIWKNLSVIVAACGGTFAPYLQQLRRYIGEDVSFYCHGYTASEGVLSVPVALNSTQMILLPNSCYFEFQPFDENNHAADSENREPPVLRMEQLEVGKTYLVIITNRAGLYRYRMHDVIRVVGFCQTLPVIEMMYRDDSLLSISGEHIFEDELSNAVFTAMKEYGLSVTGFSVYTDHNARPRARYVFLIEPSSGDFVPDPLMLGERILDVIEAGNEIVGLARGNGWIVPPVVKFLKTGTYEEHRVFVGDRGLGGNQVKPPQILRNQEMIDFFLNHVR